MWSLQLFFPFAAVFAIRLSTLSSMGIANRAQYDSERPCMKVFKSLQKEIGEHKLWFLSDCLHLEWELFGSSRNCSHSDDDCILDRLVITNSPAVPDEWVVTLSRPIDCNQSRTLCADLTEAANSDDEGIRT